MSDGWGARGAGVVGLVLATTLVGCAPSGTPTASPASTADGPAMADPEGLTTAELDGVDSCDALHTRVSAWLDVAAERARALQPDRDALSLVTGAVVLGRMPDGVEAFGGMLPSRPYAGIAGEVASQRYEQLGCSPDDEFPALLAWAGLPDDTPLGPGADPLLSTLEQRMADDGAGGFVALGIARRLTEGAARSDSDLMVALADVARAQESFRATTGAYATDLEQLRELLDDPGLVDWEDVDDPLLVVTKATADAYCIHGADGASGVVESHDGTPRNRAPGTSSCPNTFADLDGCGRSTACVVRARWCPFVQVSALRADSGVEVDEGSVMTEDAARQPGHARERRAALLALVVATLVGAGMVRLGQLPDLPTVALVSALAVAVDAARPGRLLRARRGHRTTFDEVDPATGVGNARAVLALLDREAVRARSYGSLFSVAVLEVDRPVFAGLHPRRADRVLLDLVRGVATDVRTGDRVSRVSTSDRELVVVVLPDTGATGARTFAERLLARTRRHLLTEGAPPHGHVRTEVLSHPDDGVALARLQRRIEVLEGTDALIRDVPVSRVQLAGSGARRP